jgi:hypothetical protein
MLNPEANPRELVKVVQAVTVTMFISYLSRDTSGIPDCANMRIIKECSMKKTSSIKQNSNSYSHIVDQARITDDTADIVGCRPTSGIQSSGL